MTNPIDIQRIDRLCLRYLNFAIIICIHIGIAYAIGIGINAGCMEQHRFKISIRNVHSLRTCGSKPAQSER